MFEIFKARSVERDQALDAKRIARMMAALSDLQNDCMDELAGLTNRMEDYKNKRSGADKSAPEYFELPTAIDGLSRMSLTAAEKRLELLNGYINTCMKLRSEFMIDIQTNQSAVENLIAHSSAANKKTHD